MIRGALALKVARKSPHPHRHAALIIKGGALVAAAYNHDGIHAEVNALSKLWPNKRRGTTLLSFRLTRAGKWGMAKPCAKCEKALRKAGVSRVYYTNHIGQLEQLW